MKLKSALALSALAMLSFSQSALADGPSFVDTTFGLILAPAAAVPSITTTVVVKSKDRVGDVRQWLCDKACNKIPIPKCCTVMLVIAIPGGLAVGAIEGACKGAINPFVVAFDRGASAHQFYISDEK